MDEVLEQVVAENRRLRKEVKALRARVTAVESSRWWKLHPRFALRRSQLTTPEQQDDGATQKIASVAQQWRLRRSYDRLNEGAAPDEVVLREGIRLKVHPVARGTFEGFCYWAPETVDEFDVFLANTHDRHALLDAGALHGVFSLVFARDPAKRALAVDASPIAFATLLYNINRNAATNVTAVECALSDSDGELEMHYDGDYAVVGDDRGAGALPVPSRSGDSLCAEHAFEPDAVKIDVEGHELRVLQGLRATIARNRPLLFLELHPALIAQSPENGTVSDVVEELRSLGYSRFEHGGRTLPVEALTELVHIERLLLRPDA